MHIASETGFVHNHLGGHAAQLEQVEFLSKLSQNVLLWIRQTDEGQVFFLPESGKGFRIFRPNDEYDSVPFNELVMILTQLRQMPAAERSKETPVEHHDNMLLPLEVRKADRIALPIIERKIKHCQIDCNFVGHTVSFQVLRSAPQ